jgi:hypothetical protein
MSGVEDHLEKSQIGIIIVACGLMACRFSLNIFEEFAESRLK